MTRWSDRSADLAGPTAAREARATARNIRFLTISGFGTMRCFAPGMAILRMTGGALVALVCRCCTRNRVNFVRWLTKFGLDHHPVVHLGDDHGSGMPLSTALVLKDTQGGFAGETGMVWTIAPDCSYTVARQIGLKALDPHKQGRLAR